MPRVSRREARSAYCRVDAAVAVVGGFVARFNAPPYPSSRRLHASWWYVERTEGTNVSSYDSQTTRFPSSTESPGQVALAAGTSRKVSCLMTSPTWGPSLKTAVALRIEAPGEQTRTGNVQVVRRHEEAQLNRKWNNS